MILLTAAAALLPSPSIAEVAPGIHGLAVTAVPSRYPCVVPFCSGPLTGLGTAVVVGTSVSSVPFSATWPDPTRPVPSANTSGSIYDLDDNCLAGGPTPSDSGSGDASVTLAGGLLAYQGQELSGATLTVYFSFQRTAAGLLIFVSSAAVATASGTVVATEQSLANGAGGGTWAVLSGVATCGAPLTNPQVRISASSLVPD